MYADLLSRATHKVLADSVLYQEFSVIYPGRMLSPNFRRFDLDVFAIRSYGFPLLVSFKWLTHIEGVTAVVVVVCYPSIDGVSEKKVSIQVISTPTIV